MQSPPSGGLCAFGVRQQQRPASKPGLRAARLEQMGAAGAIQIANFFATPSGRRLSYSSNGWWIHGLVGSISTK